MDRTPAGFLIRKGIGLNKFDCSRSLTNRASNEFNYNFFSVSPLIRCIHMDGPTERAKIVKY